MRLAFFGTPEFAVPALEALIAAGHELACVYTQPPRAAGRGQQPRPSPVQAAAPGLPVRTPAALNDPETQRAFAALDLDAGIVVAYGLILPASILTAPRHGCLNIHASLLPRWRGAAPIQRAILAGDKETGVTIMQMDEGLDSGPMLLAESVSISADATAESLHDELASLGARLIVEALARLAAATLAPTPQPDAGVTHAPKLARAEGRLDWTRPAAELARLVRAFAPWPGAYFDHAGEHIKVLAADAVAGAGAPGAVLEGRLTVACGEGALRLTRLQRGGKRVMAAAEFLRGYSLAKGVLLAAPKNDD